MGRFSWIIQVGPECNHKCPYNRKTETDLTTEVDVTTDAKDWSEMRKGS